MSAAAVFDDRACELGEGALWRPETGRLYWFDITAGRMLARDVDGPREWRFGECVSAAAALDADRLLVAAESGLSVLDTRTGVRKALCAIGDCAAATRSNDGRADPCGGFWASTMGKAAEPGAGAIYRWRAGELRRLYSGLTIPNAICFAPDGRTAHFADTTTRRVLRVALDAEGWPAGEPVTFLDLGPEGLNPDGAVTDAEGLLWLAEWGAGRVCAYAPDGARVRVVTFPAPHVSCPAFGGPDLTTLFCTSALQGMDEARRAASPKGGMTFAVGGVAQGRPEPMVTS